MAIPNDSQISAEDAKYDHILDRALEKYLKKIGELKKEFHAEMNSILEEIKKRKLKEIKRSVSAH